MNIKIKLTQTVELPTSDEKVWFTVFIGYKTVILGIDEDGNANFVLLGYAQTISEDEYEIVH